MLSSYSFWIYPFITVTLVYSANRLEVERTFVDYIWLVPASLLIWTVLEYGLHRFIFHWNPCNTTLRKLVFQLHLAHHADPRNPKKIPVWLIFTIPVSTMILSILYAWTTSLFSAVGIMVGLWTGFLYYEWVHYNVHVNCQTYGIGWHRKQHFLHHFLDQRTCYGVTSPVWDLVFGTFRRQ